MKFTPSTLILLSATAASAARREHDGHGRNGGFGFGDSCLNSCLTSHLSISLPTERPTATSDHSAHMTAYSSALSSLCGNTFPTARAAIDSCLRAASCTNTDSRTWDSSYATSLCSAYSSCASATASDAACTGWYGFGFGSGMDGQGGWRGHGGLDGPGGHGRHGDGNGTENGRGGGRWGQSKGPDGNYRVGPSGTCTDGMVTTTATTMNTVTDAQGAVQTSMGLEVRTGTVVKMEQVDGENETSAVGVPMSTASAAASQLGVEVVAALAGLAVGVVAVL